jgi:hypothetical protein
MTVMQIGVTVSRFASHGVARPNGRVAFEQSESPSWLRRWSPTGNTE